MAKTTDDIELGTPIQAINLPDTNHKYWNINELKKEEGIVVMFICNHCPYVQIIADKIDEVSSQLLKQNIGFVAINANDATRYPADGIEGMKNEILQRNYSFPYLYDEEQSVAKAFRACCTPECYVYDRKLKLYYHGQFDACRPHSKIKPTGDSLLSACENMLKAMDPKSFEQIKSMGCSIKWK